MTEDWTPLTSAQRAEKLAEILQRACDTHPSPSICHIASGRLAAYRAAGPHPSDAFLAEIARMPLSREEPLSDYDDAARALDELIRRARAMQESER